jgi:hypothetical protein
MYKKSVLILIFFVINLTAQVELNVERSRIYPSSVTQTEPVATVHPLNNLVLFASAVTFNISNAFRSEGIYISTDGGINWSGSDTCKGALIYNHGGDPGVVITASGRLVLSHIGDIFPGMYSHYSTDMGINWTDAVVVTNHQTGDKGTITIDNSNLSNFEGRIYLAWIDLISPFACVSSFSTDEGETWSTPKIVNPNPPLRCVGGSVAVAENGDVYVAWSGITAALPFREDYCGFAVSTDGGESWNAQQNIFDMNGISGTLPSKEGIKVNGLPQIAIDKSGGSRNGWIYIVTTEFDNPPAGSDPDIILHHSTDGGTTWSAGMRVNSDPINNGKIQYFPSLDIDDEGGLNILFYDDRNTTSDSTDVFLTRSLDGGNTWKEFSVKNSRFKPKPILGGSSAYQGDRIELLSVGEKFYAFWMADYSGIYQAWLSVIDRNILAVENAQDSPVNEFTLFQNYPNPFNPSTTINFSVPSSEFVTLKVFDVLGNEVVTLVNEEKPAGAYEIEFSVGQDSRPDIASGVYFYQLKSGSFIETKKMLLLK